MSQYSKATNAFYIADDDTILAEYESLEWPGIAEMGSPNSLGSHCGSGIDQSLDFDSDKTSMAAQSDLSSMLEGGFSSQVCAGKDKSAIALQSAELFRTHRSST